MDKAFSDYKIHFQQIETLAPKLNQGIQIILVINGELTVETNSRIYHMEERDLLVINPNDLYEVKGSKDNRTLTLHISDQFMNQYYDDYGNSRFECFSKESDFGKESIINTLRRRIAETMIAYYQRGEGHKLEIQGYISEIILILIRRFRQKSNPREIADTDDNMLIQVITYLEENYDQPLTLEETANQHYLSVGYLSRYFKQKMGIGFKRFLMNIRMEHALKELLYTSNSISQIALNNGFPNTKSFTTLFKELYEDTPTSYRIKHQVEIEDKVKNYDHETDENIVPFQNILGKLGMFVDDANQHFNHTETRFEQLTINLASSKPQDQKIHRPKHNLSIGELREVLKDSVRTQILMTKRQLRLNNVAVRNLIHGSTIIPEVVTDEIIATTSPYYDVDFALNFLKKHALSLFVRVDYKEISLDEESFFTKLEHLILHCLNNYGKEYVSTWHFMFYEPYYSGVSSGELQRTYQRLYSTLKRILPAIHVGSFFPFSYKEEMLGRNHKWLLDDATKVDFYAFEANQNEIINFEELGDDRFSLEKDFIISKTNKVKVNLRKHHKERPLHLVSWNVLSGNTRHTNGTFFRAALITRNALDIGREVESLGFWINTHQHEKLGRDRNIRLEGLELYHYFSGKRPAFFAMQFLERLQGEIIAQGPEYIMTKNERGYQLILMNCNNVNPYYSIEETFMKKLNKEMNVTITGIHPGEYQIRKRIFDKDHGALYTKWWDLNSKHGMDEEVINYIINTSQPSLELFDETIDKEMAFSFYSYLTNNAIHFYDIRKMFS